MKITCMVTITVLMAGSVASADLAIELQDVGGNSFINVTAGQSFDVFIHLDTTDPLICAQVFLEDLGGTGLFTLDGASFNGAAGWSNLSSETLIPTPLPEVIVKSGPIGSMATNLTTGASDGLFATLNLTVNNSAPAGDYYLNLSKDSSDLVFLDVDYQGVTAEVGGDFRVSIANVVPAPGAVMLAVIGLAFVGGLRRRGGLTA